MENLRPGDAQDSRSSRWPSHAGAPVLLCAGWRRLQFAKLTLRAKLASYSVGCACINYTPINKRINNISREMHLVERVGWSHFKHEHQETPGSKHTLISWRFYKKAHIGSAFLQQEININNKDWEKFPFSVLEKQNTWITTHSSHSWKIGHYLEKGLKIPLTPKSSASNPLGCWHQGGCYPPFHCFMVVEERTQGISQQFLNSDPQ